jgi:hypothetical protein
MSGEGAKRATRDNRSLAGADRVLVQRRFSQIPMDRGQIFEAELIGAASAVPHTRFLHAKSSQTGRRARASPSALLHS